MWDQVEYYFVPWVVLIGLSLLLMRLCRFRPQLARKLFGILFLLGGLANVYLAFIYPRDYLEFGRFTFLPSYRWFIYMVLFRQAWWLGSLLIALHFYLAWQFLRPGELRRSTVLLAGAFLVLLAPLGFGSAFPASLILLLGLYELRRARAS